MQELEVSQLFFSSFSKVLALFWDIKKWVYVSEPIKEVTINYDDGYRQDFMMRLIWNNQPSTIRTVRFMEWPDKIAFFSPTPPSPFLFHRGAWLFKSLGDNRCWVTAHREFLCDESLVCQYSLKLKKQLTALLRSLESFVEKSNED